LVFKDLCRTNLIRQSGDDFCQTTGLVVRPQKLNQFALACRVDPRSGDEASPKERSRQSSWCHQCIANRRDVVSLLIVFHEYWLAKQIRKRHTEYASQIRNKLDISEAPLATFNLAEPVSSAANEIRKLRLRVAAPRPIEGDPLADS